MSASQIDVRRDAFAARLVQRLVILDGAMGTMIQRHRLSEEQFRGARFAQRCGASVPGWLRNRFDGLDDDPETRRMIAANVAIEQVQRLREHGVDEFHFYTLNRGELAYAICHALGLRPRVREARVA